MFWVFALISYVIQKPSKNLKNKPISWSNGMVEFYIPDSNDSVLLNDFRMYNGLYFSNVGHENLTLYANSSDKLLAPRKYRKHCFIFSGIHTDTFTLRSTYDGNAFSLGVLAKNSNKLQWKSYLNLDQNSSSINISELISNSDYPIVFLSINPKKSPGVNDSIVIEFGENEREPISKLDKDEMPYLMSTYSNSPNNTYHSSIFPSLSEVLDMPVVYFKLGNIGIWIIFSVVMGCVCGVGLLLLDIFYKYPYS